MTVMVYRGFGADDPIAPRPPFTLGHEVSGWADELAPGVTAIFVGDATLSMDQWECGHCSACVAGAGNLCENPSDLPRGIGLGRDGGMADCVAVPARHLVPLGDADPVAAAPLTDAALTPYHAIKASLPHLGPGGSYALVFGLGAVMVPGSKREDA